MDLDKFERFLRVSQNNQKQLNEALAVCTRLKEEITLSRGVEANLRNQLMRVQNRSLSLQRDLNVLLDLKGKSDEQQTLINAQAIVLHEFRELIDKLQNEVRNKVLVVSSEVQQANKIKSLEERVQTLGNQYKLLRIEHQLQLKEKDSSIKRLEENVAEANRALEKTKLDYDMMKNDFDRVHLTYNKKIMDCETTIRQYEKDRTLIWDEDAENYVDCGSIPGPSILKKTDKIANLWDKKVNITWADAARKASTPRKVLQDSEVSSQGVRRDNYQDRIPDKGLELQVQPQSPDLEKVDDRRPKFKPKVKISHNSYSNVKSSTSVGTAPKLEVFSITEDSQQPKRKRLYSGNSNHFL